MTVLEAIFFVLLLLLCFGAAIGVNAAYHNGVNDGFGFSQEPWNPGYAKAGRYLRDHMQHKWPNAGHRWVVQWADRKSRGDGRWNDWSQHGTEQLATDKLQSMAPDSQFDWRIVGE